MIDNFALIIGAMKCGTTSLFSYLAQHPMISAYSKKEAFFFSGSRRWSKGFEWYQNLWNWDSKVHKIALEASVDYTRIPIFPNAAERISTLKEKANFKFIYIIRNPIERIESHYTHGRAAGWASTEKPISEGIARDLIETSRYARQIEEYYKRFSAHSILLLNFEDLKTEPLKLLRKVCRFLEVNPDYEFQQLDKIYNANKQRIADERLWRSLKRIKYLRSIAGRIPVKQKQMLYGCLGRKIEGNIKLSAKQRSFVVSELQEDLRKLSVEYGVDISRWGIEV